MENSNRTMYTNNSGSKSTEKEKNSDEREKNVSWFDDMNNVVNTYHIERVCLSVHSYRRSKMPKET